MGCKALAVARESVDLLGEHERPHGGGDVADLEDRHEQLVRDQVHQHHLHPLLWRRRPRVRARVVDKRHGGPEVDDRDAEHASGARAERGAQDEHRRQQTRRAEQRP